MILIGIWLGYEELVLQLVFPPLDRTIISSSLLFALLLFASRYLIHIKVSDVSSLI